MVHSELYGSSYMNCLHFVFMNLYPDVAKFGLVGILVQLC